MLVELTEREFAVVAKYRLHIIAKKLCRRMANNAIVDGVLLSGSSDQEHRANVTRLRKQGYGTK